MSLKLLSLFLALNFIVTFFIIIKHWIFFYFVLLLRISKSNLPKKRSWSCVREREREQWGLVLRNQKVALKVESNCRRREGTAGNEEEVQNATFRSMTIFSLRTTLIDLTSTLPSKSKVVILIHSFISFI